MASKYAKEMTREQFAAAMRRGPIVVLPVGSMEAHGAHLPLGSDTYEIDYVMSRLAEKLDLVVLPTLNYGNCGSTYNFPGTISITFETVRAVAYDVIGEIARHGGRRILIISGHAGSDHMSALRMAAKHQLKRHENLRIMVMSDYDLVPEFKGAKIPDWDGHGGMAETSRMLNIRPDISSKGKSASRPKSKPYAVEAHFEKLNPAGFVGDPRKASAELGKKIDDFILRKLIKLIERNLLEDD